MPQPPPSQRHSVGLYILTFSEFWDRFSYYGIQALLVLYLTKAFLFSDGTAYSLYGVFTALTFTSTILGGIVADKFIGFKNGVLIGILLIVLGNFFLSLQNQNFMYMGLATLICGIGFFKPNSSTLVGGIYAKNTALREGGFSIFYMGMNAGTLLGPSVYGYISNAIGWRAGFMVSTVGIALSFLLFLLKKTLITPHQPANLYLTLKKKVLLILGIVFFISLFAILIKHSDIFGDLLSVIAIATVFGLAWIAIKSSALDRKHIIGLSILSFFCIFYFSCSLQTATTLTLFIERQVNRHLFGMELPTMMFLSLQPFFIILLASFMGRFWSWLHHKQMVCNSTPKIAIGLFFAAVSFFIFSWAANCPETGYYRIGGVVAGNIFLSLGELCTFPILLSAVSEFAPAQWRSTMMGTLFLSLAFSGYFAGVVAKITSEHTVITGSNHIPSVNYSLSFAEIGITALSISVLILASSPLLSRLLHSDSRSLQN